MKTLENISNDRLFVIVRNSGIKSDILVTNKKYLGALAASMFYGTGCGSKEYQVKVVDMTKKSLKELGFSTSVAKSFMERDSFATRSEKYAEFIKYLENPENQYDLVECITSYKYKPFYLFLYKRGEEGIIVKGNDPFKMMDFAKTHKDWVMHSQNRVNDISTMAEFAIYERYTGKETENEPGYYATQPKIYKYLASKFSTK